MWPDNRLRDLLGIEHPIIQAPMTGSCTPALASAVSNAGGLGSMGCAGKSIEAIRAEVNALESTSNRAFNLNFFATTASETSPSVLKAAMDRLQPWYDRYQLGQPPADLPKIGPGFTNEHLELLLEIRPSVVSFHFGYPDSHAIDALKEVDIVLLSSATNVNEARDLESAGMDAIIAQGWEAGGHRGSHTLTAPQDGVGTMALVPQVVDAVSVPVIAAGGIGDGRGIAAAFALGASGVQMGTAFLGCPEAATDPARRQRIRQASDTDTIVTDSVSGRSARAMKSRYAEDMESTRSALPGFRQMSALSGPILDAADIDEASFLLFGQAAALVQEIDASALVQRLAEDARTVFSRL